MSQDRQTRFQQLFELYVAHFKEDPPAAALTVDEAIRAMEEASARNRPLLAPVHRKERP